MLTDNQWDNIIAYLEDQQGSPISSAENFTTLLRTHWDDVINPTKMRRQSKRKRLRELKEQATEMDTTRVTVDEEITQLEDELSQ